MSPANPEVQTLSEALAGVGISNVCPCCGHEGWTAFSTLVTLTKVVGGIHQADGHSALPVACDRCGFIRLHLSAVLDQYIDPRGGH